MTKIGKVRCHLPVVCLAVALAQEPNASLPPQSLGDAPYKLGVTVVSTEGFRGDIYLLKPGTEKLPNFKRHKAVGSIYTPVLDVPARTFTDGFPGVTNRFEWFAIDYNGKFWVENPGRYRFALESDDGSMLYIDGKLVIDNDGIHPPALVTGNEKLKKGMHRIRVSYFQGPRDFVELRLGIEPPGEEGFRIFNTDHFHAPLKEADRER